MTLTSSARQPPSERTAPAASRPLRAAEAAVIRRLLQLEQTVPHLDALLAAVDSLSVREGCACGGDSLFFEDPRSVGRPVARGVGLTTDDLRVEVVLWARAAVPTFLEIQSLSRPRQIARLPRPESITPYPTDWDSLDW
ncbi:MAG: hypothetical protein ACHQAR_04210 [Steroidobacterales bacterium]